MSQSKIVNRKSKMSESFRAFRAHNRDGKVEAGLEDLSLDDLGPGEVVIRAAWSSVNYKDALAGTGEGKIMRRFPLVGGIDVSGTVATSSDDRFNEGDPVVVTGYGLSQDHDGGYSEYVRVPADWVVPLPEGLSLRAAMALGTAGFTAGMALERMEQADQEPSHGPILVTGATGGVGSFAVDLFSAHGYEVVAVTGKQEQHDYLRSLGAAEIVSRQELELSSRPLERGRWGGVVDNVGGAMLSGILPCINPWGCVASIGLAGGHKLNTTVMPFIIRGVALLGITSSGCPMPFRQRVWDRLAKEYPLENLDQIVTGEITMEELPGAFRQILDGKQVGRTVVKIAED